MIYTVTFNPSLDYIVSIRDFQMGKTNRTVAEQLLPGGKGFNVSAVLTNLGVDNIALGFLAGFTGREIAGRMREMGLRQDCIWLEEGLSRINVKMKDFEGTEINGAGPIVDEKALDALLRKLDRLQKEDILVLAGSVPRGVPTDLYRDICKRLSAKGVSCVVDASGELLPSVLPFHPFLIKPNRQEVEELFGGSCGSREEALGFAVRLREMGAGNVLISLGGEGAVLADETGARYALAAPEGKLVNAVGAGDSMIAGFLAGWQRTWCYRDAFRMAVAAGSASAFSDRLADREGIRRLLKQMDGR